MTNLGWVNRFLPSFSFNQISQLFSNSPHSSPSLNPAAYRSISAIVISLSGKARHFASSTRREDFATSRMSSLLSPIGKICQITSKASSRQINHLIPERYHLRSAGSTAWSAAGTAALHIPSLCELPYGIFRWLRSKSRSKIDPRRLTIVFTTHSKHYENTHPRYCQRRFHVLQHHLRCRTRH